MLFVLIVNAGCVVWLTWLTLIMLREQRKERCQMATIQELKDRLAATLAVVTAETSRITSVEALLDGLRQQVGDLLEGAVPADVVAQVEEIFNVAQNNSAEIDRALNAGVPPPVA